MRIKEVRRIQHSHFFPLIFERWGEFTLFSPIFKKSAIPDETWDSFFKNDIIINDQNLNLSIEDQKYVSILMQFVKKEYLIYDDEIFLNESSLPLISNPASFIVLYFFIFSLVLISIFQIPL